MSDAPSVNRGLRQIFVVPALLGLSSAVGLVAGLVADGLWDAVSWLALAPVVLLALWHGLPWRGRTAISRGSARPDPDGVARRTSPR